MIKKNIFDYSPTSINFYVIFREKQFLFKEIKITLINKLNIILEIKWNNLTKLLKKYPYFFGNMSENDQRIYEYLLYK